MSASLYLHRGNRISPRGDAAFDPHCEYWAIGLESARRTGPLPPGISFPPSPEPSSGGRPSPAPSYFSVRRNHHADHRGRRA